MNMNKYLNGYLQLPRSTLLLLQETDMDFADYGFYLFLVQIADWDKGHSTYGVVKKNDVELARITNCNPSTIGRRKQKLLKYGVILLEHDSHLMKIVQYEKFTSRIAQKLSRQPIASSQDEFAQSQIVIADTQNRVAEMQKSDLGSEHSFSSSFKDNLCFSETSIPLEDQEWINENITE